MYYASVSFMDDQFGKLLKSLKEAKFDENTIITFVSDHGFALGEHNQYGKLTNFEEALQVRLCFCKSKMSNKNV